MFSSQNQTLPKPPTNLNPRSWNNWKHEHPEFNREEYSIVAFEGKILIVGGYLEDDSRAVNLILIDPESQKFQIIQPTGDAPKYHCNAGMSVCYWEDSRFVVFGGYDYYGPSKYSSTVSLITLKDLDTDNPSACWNAMITPPSLYRYRHSAYIYKEKMYVLGGSDENENAEHGEIWCLDLTQWTWNELKFTSIGDTRQISINRGPYIFHENKAFSFFCQQGFDENMSLTEFDLETRSYKLLPISNDIRKHRLFGKICTQLVDEKILFLSCPVKRQQNGPVMLQLWVYDLDLRDWVEIPTTEPIPNLPGHLLYCNNQFVCYGKCEDGSDPFFCELWSLPWKIPKTTSTTNLSKTQQTLKEFLFEAPYSDISFEVESQIIKAHKWWLTQRNKFFANMFSSGMAEAQAAKIKITDMKASTFKALLEFLYSDQVELDTNLAFDLLQQADKYSIGELKNACEKHLIENIEPDNYVALGNIAELIGATALREAVVTFIAKNMKKIKPRKDFNEISDALLRDSLVKFIVK